MAAAAPAYAPRDEAAYLKEEADALRRDLGEIERRFEALRSEGSGRGSDEDEGSDDEG